MRTRTNVFVAMSGGVDSSIAALLLKEQGYDVSGVHLVLTEAEAGILEKGNSPLDQICQQLAIPLHKLDFRREFDSRVQSYFFFEYGRGRTPNPCVVCNQYIKFGLLLDWALSRGADFLATGHYVQVKFVEGRYCLLKGIDHSKDQSYFLYRLNQTQLSRLIFPIGQMEKTGVKSLAESRGMVIEHHSRDVCFNTGNTNEFTARHVCFEPGEIVDRQGNVLGVHQGVQKYTIGQRQGFGISARERLYVIDLDAARNRIVVGSRDELIKDSALINDITWISGHPPDKRQNIAAKIRYRAPEVTVTIEEAVNVTLVKFREPQLAVTPGQSMVFYQGEQVLGGGVITKG